MWLGSVEDERGAIPYANYAAGPFLHELRQEEQAAQQRHVDAGTSGGIEKARTETGAMGRLLFSAKFLISSEDLSALKGICEYWEDKGLMEQGNRLWKSQFPGASFIEDGWKVRLFTAPHDPCPVGRLILDFETAVSKRYFAIIGEVDARIARAGEGDAAKVSFWKAAKRSLEGALKFAEKYAGEAGRLAGLEPDLARKEEILGLAEVCQRVPALRIPLIPGITDDASNVTGFARIAARLGIRWMSVIPYHPMGQPKYAELGRNCPVDPRPPTAADLERVFSTFESAGISCELA